MSVNWQKKMRGGEKSFSTKKRGRKPRPSYPVPKETGDLDGFNVMQYARFKVKILHQFLEAYPHFFTLNFYQCSSPHPHP